MAKFLVINRPPPHRTKSAPVGACVNHFVDLGASNRATVYPIVGLKGYATLVEVDSHEELREVVRGNAAINLVLSDVMMAGVSGYAPAAVRTGSRGLA